MRASTCLFIILALAASSAEAAEKEGGGGNAVVCFDSKAVADEVRALGENIHDQHLQRITQIEILDLFEVQHPVGVPAVSPNLIQPMKDEMPISYATRLGQRFSKTLPAITDMIDQGQAKYPSSRIKNQPLFKVNDVNPVGPPPFQRCVIATIAAQDQHFLYLDRRLFDHPAHSEMSRGLTLVHEYVRFRARKMGHLDARNTRILTGMLAVQDIKTTVRALWNDLVELKLVERKHHLGTSPFYFHRLLNQASRRMNRVACERFASISGRADYVNQAKQESHFLFRLSDYTIVSNKLGIYGKSACVGNRVAECVETIESLIERLRKYNRKNENEIRSYLEKEMQAGKEIQASGSRLRENRVRMVFSVLKDEYHQAWAGLIESIPFFPLSERSEMALGVLQAVESYLDYLPSAGGCQLVDDETYWFDTVRDPLSRFLDFYENWDLDYEIGF